MPQMYMEAVYLIFVCILMVACLYVISKIKRRGFIKEGIDILANVNIGPKERLVIVDIEGEKMLLGVTPNNITHLHKFPKENMFQNNLTQIQAQKSCEVN